MELVLSEPALSHSTARRQIDGKRIKTAKHSRFCARDLHGVLQKSLKEAGDHFIAQVTD